MSNSGRKKRLKSHNGSEIRASLEGFALTARCWFWETGPDLRFTYMSDNVMEITGVSPEWHYGKTREELGIPDAVTNEHWHAHLRQLQRREPFTEFVFRRNGPDGLKWMSTTGISVFDEDGEFLGYRGTGRDITEEVRTRETADRLAAAIEALDELFVVWDSDDRLVICNKRFRDINDKVVEKTQPGTLFQDTLLAGLDAGLYPSALGREKQWWQERLAHHKNPGKPMEMQRQTGQWILVREQRLADGSTVTYSSNITELKRIENELAGYLERETEAREAISITEAKQRSTLAVMTDGVVMQDREGRILLANPAAEEIIGLTRAQMAGQDPVDPMWEAVYQDGSNFPADEYPSAIAMRTGQSQRDVIMGIHKPNDAQTWMSINSEPILAEEGGGPIATVTTYRDITDHLKKEETLTAQAEQLRKFAYLASHDLREPLRKISVLADILDDELVATGMSDSDRLVERIRAAARRGSSLVEDVLRFSLLADRKLDRGWVNLQEVIDETLGLYRNADVSLSVDIGQHELRADRDLLKICISNIVDNAIKYCPVNRRPRIDIKTMFHEGSQSHELAMGDNGIGFDPQHKSRIFEPFTRLVPKHVYEGSGIGLSFVKDILDAHGWHIDVDSEPGEGSVFRIRVPSRDVSPCA